MGVIHRREARPRQPPPSLLTRMQGSHYPSAALHPPPTLASPAHIASYAQ